MVDINGRELYSHELKIPKERVAVLIGKDGETKAAIEERSAVQLNVNSEEGDVFISGKDPLMLFNAKEVVKAVGRGFNPEIALMLLKVDYILELISLKDIAKNKNHLLRVKGRIIGTEGKTRGIIEELTMTYVSVYGKTVGIIGRTENANIAKRAVTMLIEGSPHSSVYKFLEGQRKSMRYARDDEDEIADDFKKYENDSDDQDEQSMNSRY
ncbi:MAG: KH domain-containing protein [Nanoarchaeota archaeon]